MRTGFFRTLGFAILTLTLTTAAARADVCVSIDEGRDTLNQADRAAALILLHRQFESEGYRVVLNGCTESYVVSHVKFGDTITVTLSGATGQRQAMGLSMNDVPALYSQLVRAILTGQEVGSMRMVVDRTNVIGTQAAPMRVQSDSLFYVRLGYGGLLGGASHGGPAMGIGVRRELDAFAIDVSFFNVQGQSHYSHYAANRGSTGSYLKLAALRYKDRTTNATMYYGGGLSWGGVSASKGDKYFNGSGLQGELSAGYEMLRASNIRMFVQTDVALPFYSATSVTYKPRGLLMTERRYMPSATVSLGLGWGRSGRARG
jgi:hypothetical protein